MATLFKYLLTAGSGAIVGYIFGALMASSKYDHALEDVEYINDDEYWYCDEDNCKND